MTDYSKMSDAELLALAGPKAAPDYSKMSDDELLAAAQGPSALADAAKSGGIGLAKGVISAAGAAGDARNLVGKGVDYLADKAGIAPETVQTVKNVVSGVLKKTPLAALAIGPSSGDIQSKIEEHTGEFYKPQTRGGRYAETVGETLGNPLTYAGPGGLGLKTIMGATSALGSEAAGEASGNNPYARVAGALLGGGAGAVSGPLVGAVRNRLDTGSTARKIGKILDSKVNAGAVRRVGTSLSEDAVTPASAASRAGDLGDEAMLLDMGRQLGGRAEAIATQPGKGQNTILNAVEGRTGTFGSATADRVRQTLDTEMGHSPNVVDLKDRVAAIVDSQAKPLYEKVMAAHPVVDVPISITERPVIAKAMNEAVTLAKNYGEKLQGPAETRTILSGPGYHIADDIPMPAKTSLRYWDYVKKSMDQRINGYYKSGGATELSGAEKADLGGLLDARRALVGHLDDVTEGAYKNARQVAATKPQLNEALEFGQNAFNSRLLPEEFAAELKEMSLPQQTMAKAGFRRELDRIIENSRNEGAAARRVLDTNSVLQKAETLFGPDAARAIERRISAETVFQDATQKISQNSRTAVRQELQKDTATPSTSAIGSVTIPGALAMAGRGGMNYMRGQGMNRTREAMGDILSSKGSDMGKIVELLTSRNARIQNSPSLGNPTMAALVSALSQQGVR